MKRLRGKVAVVTGGASGIGLALVERFAREGMTVVAADVRAEALEDIETLDGVYTELVDVTDFDSVASMAERVFERFDTVDVLCNNAGITTGGEGPLWERELADWNWSFDVHIWGVIHGIKAFVPYMIDNCEEGQVVNTASTNGGVVPYGDAPIYAAAKAAVVSITETLYAHLQREGAPIGASVLFPGPNWLRTNLWESWRWRPREYARILPRRTPHPSLEEYERVMKKQGVEIEYTPLEFVADTVVRGIRDEQFWMLPDSDATDEMIRSRAASMLSRTNPDYFRDRNPK